MAEVGAEWRKRKTDLAVAVDRPGIVGRADAEKLSSVLDHLIQNAIEASGVAGAVSLALRAQEGEAWIEVADDGPGMTDEYVRDKLFRPLDSAKDAGYGLGAYQARQLVRDMGGRLEVSTAPGKGTTMRVILTQTEQN
ncbi:MAG: hypothetical protein KDE22_00815 [Rhodobacterales bacterium]|nr:hypothetical protein [Rhodobacterales bacterium]